MGRLVGFKGTTHLLAASARLGAGHRLAIAGDGPDRLALVALAAELGIADRVEFLGRLAPAELDALRRRSTVVVVPALSPEVFGLVGPEALVLGVPVVAYRVGGTAHWIERAAPLAHGVTVGDLDGLVAALGHVLDERIEPAARARVARDLGEQLSPRRHAERLMAVFSEAVAAVRGAPQQALAGARAN